MNRLPKSPAGADDLPQPDAPALERSEQVLQHVRALIHSEGGFIGFDSYMDAALYLQGAGYYVAGLEKFGASGDFITAPESGALFGSCLARQCDQVLGEVGGDIIEFGAGTGALAAQILSRVSSPPQRYLIVETSPELIARQRQTLQACPASATARVQWISELPESLTGVVIANEVLDAMPVVRFVVEDESGQLVELGVGIDHDQLVNCLRIDTNCSDLDRRFGDLVLPRGYRSEFNPRAEAWCSTIAQALDRGMLLVVDYGYPFAEYYAHERATGTLRCHYRHRAHDNALLWPGLQDITAHVDFTAMANAGLAAGLELAGYASQANFLMSCGLIDFVKLDDTVSDLQRMQLTHEVNRLTSPSAMGESFKALAMTRGFDKPPLGFSGRDQRHLLFQAWAPSG